MMNQENCNVLFVCKLFQKPDVLIVVRVQIAVAASSIGRAARCQSQRAWSSGCSVKNCSICCSNPCLSVSAMIAKCSVGGASSVRSKSRVWMRWNESSRLRYSDFALRCCKIPEWLPLRNAQAKPQSQPRLADLRCTREDMQAFWNEFIHQKMRRFIRPILQIFCVDGFQFGHFFTSFPFAIDILRYMF